MVHGCMVYTERAEMAAVSCGTSHTTAVSKYTTSVDIEKHATKKEAIHSCRITCERIASARERRIVLYKSDQQFLYSPGAGIAQWLERRTRD